MLYIFILFFIYYKKKKPFVLFIMSLDSTNIEVVCLFYLAEINSNNNYNNNNIMLFACSPYGLHVGPYYTGIPYHCMVVVVLLSL